MSYKTTKRLREDLQDLGLTDLVSQPGVRIIGYLRDGWFHNIDHPTTGNRDTPSLVEAREVLAGTDRFCPDCKVSRHQGGIYFADFNLSSLLGVAQEVAEAERRLARAGQLPGVAKVAEQVVRRLTRRARLIDYHESLPSFPTLPWLPEAHGLVRARLAGVTAQWRQISEGDDARQDALRAARQYLLPGQLNGKFPLDERDALIGLWGFNERFATKLERTVLTACTWVHHGNARILRAPAYVRDLLLVGSARFAQVQILHDPDESITEEEASQVARIWDVGVNSALVDVNVALATLRAAGA